MARLKDRYGSYGVMGLALLHCAEQVWTGKLLLMSCRVMSRGVGMIALNHIMGMAKRRGVRRFSEFVPNDRNRMMHVGYKFAGFRQVGKSGDRLILENDLSCIRLCTDYVQLRCEVN